MTDMSRPLLRDDLRSMLMDASAPFHSGDFDRHLDQAAALFDVFRPRVIAATLTLVGGTRLYAAPADLSRPLGLDWGAEERAARNPWDDDWPGVLPTLSTVESSGVRRIQVSPAPTSWQVTLLGAEAGYRYAAVHNISDTAASTTLPGADRTLLLLRALVLSLQDLAARGVAKPVSLGGRAGISVPRNGTPAALAEQLLQQFNKLIL